VPEGSKVLRLANGAIENPDTKRQDLPPALSNEQIYQAVRVHHYTLKDVGNFVGLLYFSICMISKRFHETMKS
jgi:hypothetical protein